MSTARSLTRLIEKERERHRVRHGYVLNRPDRGTHVQVEGEAGQLILVANHPDGPVDEVTDSPSSRSGASVAGCWAGGGPECQPDHRPHTLTVRRFLTPGSLDLIMVTFVHSKQARKFQPLAWFSPEGTGDSAYQGRSMALSGLPSAPEVEDTDAALHSLLDTLGGCVRSHPPQAVAPQPVSPSVSAEAEADDEQDRSAITIEESVIRELARSLSPRQR
jgi:hypothetical protein